jgi:hypothetical protein
MKHKHETEQPAHLSQVERGVRPLADRLEDHGLQYGERLYYEAAKELRRLHAALATESSRKCATEHDCVWQPDCAHNGKCMRPDRPQAA